MYPPADGANTGSNPLFANAGFPYRVAAQATYVWPLCGAVRKFPAASRNHTSLLAPEPGHAHEYVRPGRRPVRRPAAFTELLDESREQCDVPFTEVNNPASLQPVPEDYRQ
jgi:hypothetical protein